MINEALENTSPPPKLNSNKGDHRSGNSINSPVLSGELGSRSMNSPSGSNRAPMEFMYAPVTGNGRYRYAPGFLSSWSSSASPTSERGVGEEVMTRSNSILLPLLNDAFPLLFLSEDVGGRNESTPVVSSR